MVVVCQGLLFGMVYIQERFTRRKLQLGVGVEGYPLVKLLPSFLAASAMLDVGADYRVKRPGDWLRDNGHQVPETR